MQITNCGFSKFLENTSTISFLKYFFSTVNLLWTLPGCQPRVLRVVDYGFVKSQQLLPQFSFRIFYSTTILACLFIYGFNPSRWSMIKCRFLNLLFFLCENHLPPSISSKSASTISLDWSRLSNFSLHSSIWECYFPCKSIFHILL